MHVCNKSFFLLAERGTVKKVSGASGTLMGSSAVLNEAPHSSSTPAKTEITIIHNP